MDKLLIHGGHSLKGEVPISGAKNAALPILCAAILVPGTLELDNVPNLQDVGTTLRLLERMGVKSVRDGGKVALDASQINHLEAAYDLVKTMRASILVLGPLLARFGEARVRYRHLMTTDAGAAELDAILGRGALRARSIARATVARCYDAVGMDNASARLRRTADSE